MLFCAFFLMFITTTISSTTCYLSGATITDARWQFGSDRPLPSGVRSSEIVGTSSSSRLLECVAIS